MAPEIYICTIIALAGACVTIGIVAIAAAGIRREERKVSLMLATTDRVSRRARRLNGLYTRMPVQAARAGHYRAQTLLPR